jgi:hypothetical protein
MPKTSLLAPAAPDRAGRPPRTLAAYLLLSALAGLALATPRPAAAGQAAEAGPFLRQSGDLAAPPAALPSATAAPADAIPGGVRARLAAAVDPDKSLSATPDWTWSPGADYSEAGYSVTTVGDLNGDGYGDMAVGAPRRRDLATARVGAVFIFLGSASGLPTSPSQTLYGLPYASYYVDFGLSVAPAGDVNGDGYGDLIVGSPGYGGDGAAYVYLGSAGGLQTPAVRSWTIDDFTGTRADFGKVVAPAGDVDGDGFDDVLVAAPSAWALGRGRVLLYRGGAAGPAAAAAWDITGDQTGWYIGSSVAAAGDVNGDGYADVIVGAPGASGIAPPVWDAYWGKAMIYHGGPGGLPPTPTSELYGRQAAAGFGAAVSGAGDANGDGYADVAVGAPQWDSTWAADGGRAVMFAGSGAGVGTTQLWEEFGSYANDQFGSALAPAGDTNGDGLGDLAVGASNASNGGGGRGFAAVVTGSRAYSLFMSWYWYDAQQVLFGGSVGTGGDIDGDGFSDLLVGSWAYTGTQIQEGRAQLWRGHGEAPAPSNGWMARSFVPSSFYGWDIATAGDVNGDGYDDVLASAPNYTLNVANDGLAVLFYGGPNGPTTYANWYAAGPHSNSSFGSSVSCAGDLNGDGYDDIVVGAPDYGYEGTVYVWYGGPSGPVFGAANWTATGSRVGSHFGYAVSGAGDLNGDGYADLVVGAPTDDGDDLGNRGPANEGKAYVYLGSNTGLGGRYWTARGLQAEGNFGNSVAGAGDVNGDGYDDLIIGMEAWDRPLSHGFSLLDVGRAYVYLGGSSGPGAAAANVLEGVSNDNFGHTVRAAGDIDGDGYGDVIVDAVYADPNNQGAVFVYRGGAGGVVTTAHWSFTNAGAFDNLNAGAGAGDVNGDGLSDVVVGAVFAEGNGLQDSGKVWVFAGPLTGAAATTPLRQWNGSHAYENVGNSVAGVGDVNGDGFADVGAGSPGYTGTVAGEGRTQIWYGNNRYQAGDTVARCAQQRRSDLSAPIGLGGRTAPGFDFDLRAWTGSAAGRTKVRLEWQVSASGSPLGGATLARGGWSDSSPSGAGSSQALDSGGVAVPGAGRAQWRLRVAAKSPYFPHSPWLSPSRNGRQQADLRRAPYASAVGDDIAAARAVGLAAVPNPFNPRTVLSFSLPRAGAVRVQVFDLAGRRVATLLDGSYEAGPMSVEWDGTDEAGRAVASGTYFARAQGAGVEAATKLTLVR